MEGLTSFYQDLPILVQNWLQVVAFFICAWILSRLILLIPVRIFAHKKKMPVSQEARDERYKTIRGLLRATTEVTLFLIALLLSLSRFFETSTLLWMLGFLGAGVGVSARPIISDIMAGASFIFEDTFAVGEKVEILGIDGVVEAITLRTTWLRSPSGEQYSIPNGDIRTIRNFSRGRFSIANVTLKIQAHQLARAIELLEKLGHDSMDELPNLIEPWHVINTSGEMGPVTELTILAKARFGKAAEMRTRMLTLIQAELSSEQIELET